MEVGAVAELIAGLMFAAHKNPGNSHTIYYTIPSYTTCSPSQHLYFILMSCYSRDCDCVAIGAAQTVLFLLEHSDPKESTTYITRAIEESRAFMKEFKKNASDGSSKGGSVSVLDILEASCPFTRSATQEALRLTGHTIGAIRKVMPAEGWTVNAGNGQTYHIPQGSYVGVSHIVPNLSRKRYAIHVSSRYFYSSSTSSIQT